MDGLRHRLTTKVAGNGYSPLLRSPRLPPTLLISTSPFLTALEVLEDLVGGRALGGAEAGFPNEDLDLVRRGLIHEARRRVHVLLEERPPEVVRAPMKSDLTGLFALGEPRSLDMVEVVEVEPRCPEHPQVVVGTGVARVLLLERGVPRFEAPGDERGKAVELVLKGADRIQVFDHVVVGLDVAVHHRRRRAEAERVGLAVHLEPAGADAFLVGDLAAHALPHNLRPPPPK